MFNPSYRVDKNIGKEEIVKLLIHRYQAPQFLTARYLFLTKDEFGKKDLKTFCDLMARVKQEYPDVVKKIEVRELGDREASSADSQHGMPRYYLVIQDRDVFEHYRQDHFEPAWNDTNYKNVTI